MDESREARRTRLFGDLGAALTPARDQPKLQGTSHKTSRKRPEETETDYAAWLVWVEDEGESYYTPEGVFVVYPDQVYRMYCLDSRHNFLRAAVQKYPLEELAQEGVLFRGSSIRLEDLAPIRERHGLQGGNARALLQALYHDNARYYHFLERFGSSQSTT